MELSTTVLIIASLLAAAGLVYWALTVSRGEDPAMKGLPSAPPAVSADVQPVVDLLFQTRSNCWEANRWLREDVVALLQQVARRELDRDEFVRRFAASGADLDKRCPAGTYLEAEGNRSPIAEFVRSMTMVMSRS